MATCSRSANLVARRANYDDPITKSFWSQMTPLWPLTAQKPKQNSNDFYILLVCLAILIVVHAVIDHRWVFLALSLYILITLVYMYSARHSKKKQPPKTVYDNYTLMPSLTPAVNWNEILSAKTNINVRYFQYELFSGYCDFSKCADPAFKEWKETKRTLVTQQQPNNIASMFAHLLCLQIDHAMRLKHEWILKDEQIQIILYGLGPSLVFSDATALDQLLIWVRHRSNTTELFVPACAATAWWPFLLRALRINLALRVLPTKLRGVVETCVEGPNQSPVSLFFVERVLGKVVRILMGPEGEQRELHEPDHERAWRYLRPLLVEPQEEKEKESKTQGVMLQIGFETKKEMEICRWQDRFTNMVSNGDREAPLCLLINPLKEYHASAVFAVTTA